MNRMPPKSRGRLTPTQIDRILDGDVSPDDASAPLARLVDEIRMTYSVDVGKRVRAEHLRAMSHAFTPAPWADRVKKVGSTRPRIGLVPRAAVAALGIAVASGTALAATGHLPDPIANVAKSVGLNVTAPDRPNPAATSDETDSTPSAEAVKEKVATIPPATDRLARPSTPDDLASFVPGLAMDHLRAVAGKIGPRPAGSRGDALTADYVSGQISELGWRAERRAFPLPQGGQSWNIIGTPPGFRETSPYLIVGAHYDSVGPGANANASGLAVLVELARALDARSAKLPVVVVAFGAGEEQPTFDSQAELGSRHYVRGMSDAARKNLVAFVDVDEVGLDAPISCTRLATRSTEATRRCLAAAEIAGIEADERVTPSWSDNTAFQSKGMNAVWLWTGLDECCKHTDRDTVDHVKPEAVERAGRLALAMLRSYE